MKANNASAASDALRNTALILLFGAEREIRPIARRLYLRYGIPSYAILPPPRGLWSALTRLFSIEYLTVIESRVTLPSLLIAHARDLLHDSDAGFLPVTIDCTKERVFYETPSYAEAMRVFSYLTCAERFEIDPPFSYVRKKGEPT